MIDELRHARESTGWSQRTLAERINVALQAIKRLEKGVGSVATLVAAMAALDFRLTGLGPGKSLAEQLHGRRVSKKLTLEHVAARSGFPARPSRVWNAVADPLPACSNC